MDRGSYLGDNTGVQLTVRKVDSSNQNQGLAGARFLVTSENGSYSQEVVTGSDGTYTIFPLDAGTYAVTELDPPEGYEIDNPGPQYVVLPSTTGETTVTVTFTVNIRETTDGGGSLVFSRRYTSTLATETDEWFIGNRYNYTATIPQDVMDGAAITLNVSVKSWETEDASVSWGGKDEDGESTTNNNP